MEKTPANKNAELAIELSKLMHEQRNQVRQIVLAKIKENNINITYEMLEIMSCLWKKDGCNQQELADMTLRDKSSMTYLVDNLVKRQMVKRVEDENDRRNNLIYLTDTGIALKETLFSWAAEVYAVGTVDVDPTALQNAIALLQKMNANLKAW